MLKFLIEAFKASKGRMPNNMEMILLRQKAAKQSIDERKVVSIFDRSAVNPNKPILGGKNIPETEDDIRRRLMKQNEEGIASMKSKLEDPEKKADGGRIGYSIGDSVMPNNDFMNLDSDDEEYDFSDIEGQTAFLDPISLIIGGGKLIKGAKASTLAKEFLRNKAKQKIGKTIFDKVQKKINPPKYPQGPSNIKTGGGGGRDIGGSRNVGGGNTAKNSLGQTAAQATAAGTGTSQGYSQHFADGGRIGYKLGTGKKGIEGLIDLIKNKFGKKSITTADKAPTPSKTLERNMFEKTNERFKNKRMLDDDEYQDFLDEVGGADQLEAYNFDGTVGDAKRIIKEQKQYMDDMELEYKKGNLDPEPGDKSPARKRFLEKKLEEMEASGDKRLMTIDEIEELSSFDSDSQMDVVKSLAPKFVERLQLKQKYPGITDDLLDKILIDDNMQRKAEVLATIDEAFKMMEKGKGTDEILDTMKNVTRTKQADGGITRIGYKAGSVDKMRRLILKAMGAGTVGVGAAKSGIFSFGKGAGKEVAKEVVQKSTTTPPPYFFKLAEKIKMLGNDATATTERVIAKSLKSKDGKSEYLLEEDVTSGDTIIKKINKESDEMITDVEIMDFKKGEVVIGKNGKPVKTPDNYEEVTEANARIEGDVFNDPYYSDGIEIDEIMKEVGEQAPSIKKASGGIARLGYQVGGDVSYDATDPIYGSSAATFTPDTVMDQFGNQVQAEMGNNFNKPLIPQVTDQAANKSPSRLSGGITDIPAAGGMGGLGEVDLPVAGGNNNIVGILPVMPPVEGGPSNPDMKFTKQPVEGEGGKVVGNYNDPLPQDQLMAGFAEWKRNNPDKVSMTGHAAMSYMTLPNGEPITFSGGAQVNNMRQYLESIGQPPMTPGNQVSKPIGNPNSELKMALASGGIARMLGE